MLFNSYQSVTGSGLDMVLLIAILIVVAVLLVAYIWSKIDD